MKNLLVILPFMLFTLLGCSSKEEKKEEVREAVITQKQEILTEEEPLEINYTNLKKLIDANSTVPLGFFGESDILPSDGSFGSRVTFLSENSQYLFCEIHTYNVSNYSINTTYLGVFSKEDGILSSYQPLSTDKAKKNVNSSKLLGYETNEDIISFAISELDLVDSLEEDANQLTRRKVFFKINELGELVGVDTLFHKDAIRFGTFIKKFKNNQELTEYQAEVYYLKFAEVSIQQVNYFETIFSSDDILVFRVRWSISDQTLESIWVYTVYGEFKSSCEAIYPFEDYGVKIKKESFEVVDKKKRKISINIDWTGYELISDDEAGFNLGDKTVGKGTWDLHIADDFTCNLIPKNVEKTKISFLDFIERFKNERDISKYQEEAYYSKFAKISIQSIDFFETIYSNNGIMVFRVRWSISDYTVEEIWVYSKEGEFKSSCSADYPFAEYGMEIKSERFEIANTKNIEIKVSLEWGSYELIPYEDDYGFELGDYSEDEGVWLIKVDEQFQCSIEEVKL